MHAHTRTRTHTHAPPPSLTVKEAVVVWCAVGFAVQTWMTQASDLVQAAANAHVERTAYEAVRRVEQDPSTFHTLK